MIGSVIGVLFDGLAYGSLLFIISIGLSVTMGLMNFVNLAHGAFAMLGGYASVVLMSRAGMPFLATLPIAFVGRSRVPWVQRALYWVPLVGPIWRFRGLAEFSRLMEVLLGLKVPLPQALRAVGAGVREGDLRVAARARAEMVESGTPLSDAMKRFPELNPKTTTQGQWQ